jgi:hypothetical protein
VHTRGICIVIREAKDGSCFGVHDLISAILEGQLSNRNERPNLGALVVFRLQSSFCHKPSSFNRSRSQINISRLIPSCSLSLSRSCNRSRNRNRIRRLSCHILKSNSRAVGLKVEHSIGLIYGGIYIRTEDESDCEVVT